ncbi:hypothetical protein MA16_Dca014576 [Dendrobium catenatum]|uniref:Uncharacterized protein n=1 Tax=Dendrobium catenatum TaxID=906689 RepID=A0A2I0XJP8_9ASPA|nr:hypothetical protein MA16_Dca014576 [Dendrobium catenatum]
MFQKVGAVLTEGLGSANGRICNFKILQMRLGDCSWACNLIYNESQIKDNCICGLNFRVRRLLHAYIISDVFLVLSSLMLKTPQTR